MPIPNKSILIANGILRSSEDPNNLYCTLCSTGQCFDDWEEHLANPMHAGTLQRFDMFFGRKGSKVCCKLCTAHFVFETLKIHAKWHKIVPWYRPDDLYKTFMENQILEWENQFYCFLCDTIFPQWFAALFHVTEQKHYQASKAETQPDEAFSLSGTVLSTKFFVSNGLFPIAAKTVGCRICGCDNMSLSSVEQHVNGLRHEKLKLKLIIDILRKRDIVESCEKKASEIDESQLKLSNANVSTNNLKKKVISQKKSCGYIIDLDDTKWCCKICNCEIARSIKNMDEHLAGKEHRKASMKYGCDKIFPKKDETYRCSCCNCDLSDCESVYSHIKGKRHLGSLAELQQSSAKVGIASPPEVRSDALHWTLPCNAVKKISEEASCCRICNIKLIGSKAINSHVTGKPHEKTLKSYGFDKISVKGTQYYCSRCKCQVPGLNNVYLHVKGNNHSVVNVPKQQEVQTHTKVANKTIHQTELKTTKKRRTRKPCSKHKRKTHKPIVIATCNICNTSVASSEELHTHLLGHFSEGFNSEDKNCSQGQASSLTETTNEAESAIQNENMKLTAESFDSNNESINIQNDDDDDLTKNLLNPVLDNPRKKHLSQVKSKNQKIGETLQFDEDRIYDMRDRLKETELGIKLSFAVDSQCIYCLICQQNVAGSWDDYYEHLCSLAHCGYLDEMENDHALFRLVPEQFSALDLASQYMEEISDETVRCLICDMEINNSESELKDHIDDDAHEKECTKLHVIAKKNYERIKLQRNCDWYSVKKYWCVPCTVTTESEVSFVAHLTGSKHENVVAKLENTKDRLVYDSCVSCALLWYGPGSTYAEHCKKPLHNWLKRDGHYLISDIPLLAKRLLDAPEEFIEKEIDCLDLLSADEFEKEKKLISDLEKTVRTKFLDAKVHPFGSRVSGLGSPDSDIDIFLDCGNMYDGRKISEDELFNIMSEVQKCLGKSLELWDIKEFLPNCRSPLIKVYHRSTGISCDISFENGLSVENTKLIKCFINVFPMARKMILFMKQWLILCELAGSDRITSYALYWFVIFYLQKESILPGIATLIAMKNKSHTIAGWEVGVTHDFTYNAAESNLTLKELLKRFFKFYANFNYRYDVAAPIIGDTVKKRAFTKMENLPEEMAPYIGHMKNSPNAEGYRTDSPMSTQDPFDLLHNITKAVNKVVLNRFRTYCSKSLDTICSSESSHVIHRCQTQEAEKEELKDFVIL